MSETLTSSTSSTSSCASFSSFEDVSVKSSSTVKFVCSYGGKILPRCPDGKLRYFGGETRVLAVDRSVPFSELQAKMGELSGWSAVSVRCQLPADDLDALVSVTSDEDLANLIEEYDLASRERIDPLKIKAFLHRSASRSPPSSSKASSSPHRISSRSKGKAKASCCIRQISASSRFSGRYAADPRFFAAAPAGRHQRYLVLHGNNHWHREFNYFDF